MAKQTGDKPIFKPFGLDRDAVFEEPTPLHLWCLHCERTYVRGHYRKLKGLQMCPYEGCDGDAVIDAWDWNQIRDENPSYPENPVEGVVYPLYGTKKK